ncbi:MAG: hypothetical protein RL154_779 [Pseudomonadota bacterium]|jgi:hypothetical protein
MDLIQVISLLGAMLCLIPFAAVQLNKLKSDDYSYIIMNFFGGSILATVAVIQIEYGFILMECVWATVSFYSLSKKFLKKS